MDGLISPAHYRDSEWLAKEYKTLFSECWIFIGMMFELQGLAHRGVRVGDTDLLLQCDHTGQPRAFLNVCSHRHAQLCDIGLHAGAVRCPYHGWVYDREGLPVGIPAKAAFPEVVAAPQMHRLTEFPCENVGEFIFVRLAPKGQALRDYLGETWTFLNQISQGMTKVHDEFRRSVPSNWKVSIENSLEGYHVPTVHNKTFMEVDGMDLAGARPVDHLDHPLHSHMVHPANPSWVKRFARSEKHIGRWPNRFEHYTHRLVFPNLTVTSFMGYSFHVQSFEPSAVESTTVHSRTIGMSFEEQDAIGTKMIERIYADGHVFSRKVFEEDERICNKVQRGLRNAQRLGVLGEGIEDRVLHFQRAYVTAMTSNDSTSQAI